MIIKGGARQATASGITRMSANLLRQDTNAVVTLREIRGAIADDLEGALREFAAHGVVTRSSRVLYAAVISSSPDEPLLDAEQKDFAVDRLEKELGLVGHPRAVIEHLKETRWHLHVVWSRVDVETGRMAHDGRNFLRHEIVARDLEKAFGHERVQGPLFDRANQGRPTRAPSDYEHRQAERTGIKPEIENATITAIWNKSHDGASFMAAVNACGTILAQGDRRDFVLVDLDGEVHSLGRCIDGVRAKDIRERMSDLSRDDLPRVVDAKMLAEERRNGIKAVFEQEIVSRFAEAANNAVIKTAASAATDKNSADRPTRATWGPPRNEAPAAARRSGTPIGAQSKAAALPGLEEIPDVAEAQIRTDRILKPPRTNETSEQSGLDRRANIPVLPKTLLNGQTSVKLGVGPEPPSARPPVVLRRHKPRGRHR